jgi:hypothetical protein
VKEKIDKAVDNWFNENICNSPVSRDTEVYNHIVTAKEALKKRLQEELCVPEAPHEASATEQTAPQPGAAPITHDEGGNV